MKFYFELRPFQSATQHEGRDLSRNRIILHPDCLGQVVQKSSLKTTASVQSSAETSGIKVNGAKDGLHVFRETSKRFSSPTDIVKGHRPLPTDTEEHVFIVKQRNMAELTRILYDLSDP